MAGKKPQTFANHARLDPLFHFFVLPVFGLSTIAAIVHVLVAPQSAFGVALCSHCWPAAVAVIQYPAVCAQGAGPRDPSRRAPAAGLAFARPLRSRIPELTEGQLIALRFASDAELPKLAERAWPKNFRPTDIKKAIQSWRPDYWRV